VYKHTKFVKLLIFYLVTVLVRVAKRVSKLRLKVSMSSENIY
jgi:hypothetical protein